MSDGELFVACVIVITVGCMFAAMTWQILRLGDELDLLLEDTDADRQLNGLDFLSVRGRLKRLEDREANKVYGVTHYETHLDRIEATQEGNRP